jgi:hypothetical protein
MIALITAASIAFADATPDPNAAVVIDGIRVSVTHVRELFEAYKAAKTSDAIEITFAPKPTKAMPWYDPHWHYAGSKVEGSSLIHSTVWVNADDARADSTSRELVVGMAAGILLSCMDSGYAGPYWKKFYDAEAERDVKAAARGDNPFVHRDSAAAQVAEAIIRR